MMVQSTRWRSALAVVPVLFVLGACGSSSGGSSLGGSTPSVSAPSRGAPSRGAPSGSATGQLPRAYGSVKPSAFVYTGDSTGEFRDVTWSSWGDSVARGSGELWTNDCQPVCAAGRFHDDGRADVELSGLAGGFYTTLRITSGPSELRGTFPVTGN